MKLCKYILSFRNYLFNEIAFLFMFSAFLELAVPLSSFSELGYTANHAIYCIY